MEITDKLKKIIEDTLRRWNVPSAGYGVIKDGCVLLCEGYGLRNMERGLPADGGTLYMIASCSKAFTAAVAAKLVDEGLLGWDVPVSEYLPELKFYDEVTTEQVTLRDLLCHRTGMPRHEWSWYRTAFTREEIFFNLRYLKPNFPFRSRWQYFNQGYMIAVCAIERVTGRPFRECLEEFIFRPLGMSATTIDKTCLTDGNAAVPYADKDAFDFLGPVKAVPLYISRAEKEGRSAHDPLLGAGDICSNAEDMLKWVSFQLNMGKAGGSQLISRESMSEMRRAQITIPDAVKDGQIVPDPDADAAPAKGYGLGWETDCYRGHEHVYHGGNLDGFSALVSYVPDIDLGFVLFVNREYFRGRFDVEHKVIDAVLGEEDIDWTSRYMASAVSDNQELRKEIEASDDADREDSDCPALPLPAETYCGDYSANGYENIVIALKDGRLELNFAGFEFILRYEKDNDFAIYSRETDLPGRVPVQFEVADCCVTGLSIKLNYEPDTENVRFRKQ